MTRVLIPVDGSERSLQAVRQVIRQRTIVAPLEIHLLNVQPRIFAEDSLIGLPVDKIDTYYYDRSGKALAPAEKLLTEAGLPFASHRATGPVAETIVQRSSALDCDSILMTTRGESTIAAALLGTISAKVAHLASVPVTLVNDNAQVDFTGRLQAT